VRLAIVGPVHFLRQSLSRQGLRARAPTFDDAMDPWRGAYGFMKQALSRQTAMGPRSHDAKRWPLWFWPLIDARHVRSELASERFRQPGSAAIALIFDIPRKKTLLSRYGLWHSCLGNWPIHLREADWDCWLATQQGALHDGRSSGPAEKIGAGWDWIFPCKHPASSQPADSFEWLGDLSEDDCQAVAWAAKPHQLRGAWILTPSNRRIRLSAREARIKLRSAPTHAQPAKRRSPNHQKAIRR